jgi:hypothetical protein
VWKEDVCPSVFPGRATSCLNHYAGDFTRSTQNKNESTLIYRYRSIGLIMRFFYIFSDAILLVMSTCRTIFPKPIGQIYKF